MSIGILLSRLFKGKRRISSINAQRIAMLLARPDLLFNVNPYSIIIGSIIHDALYSNKEKKDYYAVVDGVKVYGRPDSIIRNMDNTVIVEEMKTFYSINDKDSSLMMGRIQANIYCYILNENSLHVNMYKVKMVDASMLMQYMKSKEDNMLDLSKHEFSNILSEFINSIDKHMFIYEGRYDHAKALNDIREGIKRFEGICSVLGINESILYKRVKRQDE
jgi:hypothetical protein